MQIQRPLTVHWLSACSVTAEITALGSAGTVTITSTLHHALHVDHRRSIPAHYRTLTRLQRWQHSHASLLNTRWNIVNYCTHQKLHRIIQLYTVAQQSIRRTNRSNPKSTVNGPENFQQYSQTFSRLLLLFSSIFSFFLVEFFFRAYILPLGIQQTRSIVLKCIPNLKFVASALLAPKLVGGRPTKKIGSP